jgi:hypothetical protein
VHVELCDQFLRPKSPHADRAIIAPREYAFSIGMDHHCIESDTWDREAAFFPHSLEANYAPNSDVVCRSDLATLLGICLGLLFRYHRLPFSVNVVERVFIWGR